MILATLLWNLRALFIFIFVSVFFFFFLKIRENVRHGSYFLLELRVIFVLSQFFGVFDQLCYRSPFSIIFLLKFRIDNLVILVLGLSRKKKRK